MDRCISCDDNDLKSSLMCTDCNRCVCVKCYLSVKYHAETRCGYPPICVICSRVRHIIKYRINKTQY